MKISDKSRNNYSSVIATAIAVLCICTVVITMIIHVFHYSEEQSFEKLKTDAARIRDEINLQFVSDRENLQTMANFASKLYEDEEGYAMLLQSFEKIGFIEAIGILTEDGIMMTDGKAVDVSDVLDFKSEAEKGAYISGELGDIFSSKHTVIRNAVPVTYKDETVAMLYGTVRPSFIRDKYVERVRRNNAEMYIIEGGSGNYLIDTGSGEVNNITALVSAKFGSGFSHRKMMRDITGGKSGYTSFMGEGSEEYSYAYYTPIDLSDWRLMLTKPSSVIFGGAMSTGLYMLIMFCAIMIIMTLYIAFMLVKERRSTNINTFASEIRRRLLEINRTDAGFLDALRFISEFAASRTAFFVDTSGEDYCYIRDEGAPGILKGEEKSVLIKELLKYGVRHSRESGMAISVMNIQANRSLMQSEPNFYDFLSEHDIKSLSFSLISANARDMGIICTVNPKRAYIRTLLKKISACFYMAMSNRKYVARTETMALTDTLTGVSNRMAYKEHVKNIAAEDISMLACIYIDVNELHYYNKKNGHAAGDRMLSFIAETLKNEFSDGSIYRMGGDEFLIFTAYTSSEEILQRIERAREEIEDMKYHIAVGIKLGGDGIGIEEMVSEAEREMFVDKAKYYSYVEHREADAPLENAMTMETGIDVLDACISVMSIRYSGIYYVSLKQDTSIKIVAPSALETLRKDSDGFSDTLTKYLHLTVMDIYSRTLIDFLNFENLSERLAVKGSVKVSYLKKDGTGIALSIYALTEEDGKIDNTVWVFEKTDLEK